MSDHATSLPATTDHSTDGLPITPEKEFFTEQQLALFEKMTELCRGAVRAVRLGVDQATGQDRYGYDVLVKANVIEEKMGKKTKRRIIRAFWSIIDLIRERRGLDKELVLYMGPIFQVALIMNGPS